MGFFCFFVFVFSPRQPLNVKVILTIALDTETQLQVGLGAGCGSLFFSAR